MNSAETKASASNGARSAGRVERDPEDLDSDSPYDISDLELASRLSFFLWSSIPDDELIDVAANGALRDPAALEQQAWVC